MIEPLKKHHLTFNEREEIKRYIEQTQETMVGTNDMHGKNAMMYAIAYNHLDIAKLLKMR